MIETYELVKKYIPALKLYVEGNCISIYVDKDKVFSTTGVQSTEYATTYLSGILTGFTKGLSYHKDQLKN